MPATSHPEFYSDTEALEVAKAFPEAIRGKTVVITGCNRGGIGFTTAQAFVRQSSDFSFLLSKTFVKFLACLPGPTVLTSRCAGLSIPFQHSYRRSHAVQATGGCKKSQGRVPRCQLPHSSD